ncbi:SRC kinase signaling inhibitor 1-like isoform X2 [Acanthaster planci]|uniref:SRC kinase signaling inhibitor 1-like isoform X2 n=1 Tax=Acanthaster planci TaxID=133434 RepID=A0A8B7XX27_ACAPL|nr:SRC kinase signaling inhibitor 1-like isoform X2 [Acanthaster planci]
MASRKIYRRTRSDARNEHRYAALLGSRLYTSSNNRKGRASGLLLTVTRSEPSLGTDEQGGGLRVNPAYLEQGQVATSSTTSGQRRATHSISNNSAQRPHHYYRERDRRHTLASHTPATAAAPYSQRPTTNEQKRELFLEYLKQKYPEHSGTIEMAKKPDQESLTFSNGFYDDDGTMSEMDTQATGFQRGVRVRTSLPGSRPLVNKSKEKPLGLVYLIYMSETKRALMPNEVTGMDTVKALFVRAFPRKLTMEMLDNPQRKIYIRDNSSEIFYELEKLDEVKDRVVLKIYEPGFVEETPVNIRNSTSTPLDLNICSDSELADIELPDFRERSYKTMGSRPTGTGQDRFDPLMKRPNSTTPMEMGSRRMHPQQGRPNTSTPLRSPPNNEPFQRGAPERSTAPVRPSSQAPFPRGSPQRLSSSTTLPRQQHHQQDGRRTPTNGRSLTMPRPGERGPVHRPHPEHGRQTTAMMPGPGPDPSRHPPVDRHRDPHHPQQGGGARTLERGMGPPRGTPQRTPDPRDGPRGGVPPPQHARDPPYRDSPRGHPPPSQQQGGGGSPVKAPRGEMRTDGPPYPRQPLPHEMQGRPPSRNSNQGMRQPPPNHMHPGPNRPHDRTMDRAHDRTMDRPRDRSMERPRSTPPHRVEHRGLGPPPMKHPHPPQANIREVEARMVRQGQISSTSPPGAETSERITAMEQQIASLAGMVRSVLKPGEQPPPGQQTPPPPSQQQQLAQQQQQQVSSPQRQVQQRAITDRLVSPVQTPNRSGSELTGLNEEVIRATQNQKTFTAVDSYRDGTDSQSVTPQPMSAVNTSELRETTLNLKHTVRDLRDQLKQIRKLQLNMVQDMNVAFRATNRKVQLALEATPAGNEHPIRALRTRTHQDYLKYQISRDRLDKQIRDLESAVEEMRDDVVNRHCHVNLAEVDALAQAIGNSSKHIAEQKVAFPVLADKMKAVMQGEMEIVVSEENFIKDEPGKLDDYMKRCKKVTNTLCTLKRLASVQEHRTPVVPVFEQTSQPVNREALMETIQSISPNHEQRVKNLQAANESRERKRRFHTAQELHRFQMDIGRGRQTLRKTPNLERVDQQRRAALRKLYQSEEHDSLTPILTPEKMAKQEGSKGGKKKQPPPPPPKRTYLSQQAVASRSPATSPSSPGVPEPGPNPTPKPKLVVTSSEDSEAVPVVPPKPAMMMPKSKLPQQVDDPSSARSAPDLSCMNSTSSVNSECLSSPVRDLQPTCALSPSGCKSEPFLATSENAQSSMTNPRKVVLAAQRVGKPAADKSHQCVSGPVPGTVMTTQSAPMRSPRGQATPRSGQTSPRGATSPRGVVTPEGGIMLSQGAVMIAKSGSATSPGLATTPQRQAPVRLLSSSSQASPTKTNSPTSPQYKQSCIPVLKHSQHSRVQPPTTKVSETAVSNTHTQQTSPPSNPLPQRRSSVPSAMDVAPPPKPPRGCIDDPKEPTDAPPQSAFRPLAIPGWRETSLDEVPLKKSKVRRHTVTLPQHQKRNGWVAPVTDPPLNSSPQKPQPSQQTLLPVQQKSPVGRSVITNEPKAAPVKQGVLSKSQSGTDAELNPDRKPSLQRQNSDPGARPQVTIVDKKGALKIQQLKEQYAKLRKLQEEQKLLEQQSTRSSPSQPEATQQEQPPREATSTDLLDKIPPSTTLQVDVSYSQGESSKTEDQDEGSSYTKQTVVYRVGPKPFKSDEGKQSSVPLEELEKTTTVVSTKREVIADSIPVTNGMVHQPVFSQFKVHEMAPRNFATKAKPGVAQSPAAMVNGNGMEEKPSPKPNGGHAPTDTIKSSPVKGDVVTNGGGKLPLTNGGSEVAEGQGERVIERTEKEIKKFNAANVNQNGKPELKTVYTKRLEETFIF